MGRAKKVKFNYYTIPYQFEWRLFATKFNNTTDELDSNNNILNENYLPIGNAQYIMTDTLNNLYVSVGDNVYKYDINGVLQWTYTGLSGNTINRTFFKNDKLYLATGYANSKNIFIINAVDGSFVDSYLAWNGSIERGMNAICVDSNGNIYCGGLSDIRMWKLNSSGSIINSISGIYLGDITITNDDRIFTLETNAVREYDVNLSVIGSAPGITKAANVYGYVNSIKYDPVNDVVVYGGRVEIGGPNLKRVSSFTTASPTWTQNWSVILPGDENVVDVVLDVNGDVYSSSKYGIRKLDGLTGTQLWIRNSADYLSGSTTGNRIVTYPIPQTNS